MELCRRLGWTVPALACALPAPAATYYVAASSPAPAAPYASWETAAVDIQSALSLAGRDGGLVLVSNGTYAGEAKSYPPYGATLLAVTNGVTLRSVNGPAATVIDGQGRARGVGISNAAVEGFTISHCVGDGVLTYKGGGGALLAAGGRLVDCVLTGNHGLQYGGGAAVAAGGLVSNCIVAGNSSDAVGGGLCLFAGGTVADCVVSNNAVGGGADPRGGGIGCELGGVVSNCAIVGNVSLGQGGGVAMFSNGLAVGCFIAGNVCNSGGAVGEGGGAYLHGGGTLLNCVLSNNYARWQGGAVKFYHRGGLARGCLMVDNVSDSWGGGVVMRSGGRTENCTVVRNRAVDAGGGVYFFDFGGRNVNGIIYGNVGGDLANAYADAFTYSCVPQAGLGAGNATNDPAFVDWAAGDFRPAPGSPCIDAAAPLEWMENAVDLRGRPRIAGGRPDMGAFESTR